MVNDVLSGDDEQLLDPVAEMAVSCRGFATDQKLAIAKLMVGEKTAGELADELGLPVGRVAYHVRHLATAQLIEMTRWESRRGAVARYYQLTAVGAEWLRRYG